MAIVLFVTWAAAEGAIHLLRMYQPERPDRRRAGLTWLQAAFAVSLLVGFSDAFLLRWTTLFPAAWCYVGVAATVFGIVVRMIARITLGRHFSAFVQTTDGHRLVTRGVYARVRHPAYTGFMLFLVGFPLAFGSVAALGVALAIGTPALTHRIAVEEAALSDWFGEEFRVYQRRTWRLAPLVW